MHNFTIGQKYFYPNDGATVEIIGIDGDRVELDDGVWIYRRDIGEFSREIEKAGATLVEPFDVDPDEEFMAALDSGALDIDDLDI